MDELHYSTGVLKAILVASTTDDAFDFPTSVGWAHSHVMNGTIEFATSKPGTLSFGNFMVGRSYEWKMWDYYQKRMQDATNPIDDRVRKALDDMFEPHQHHAPPERPYWDTKFENYYKGAPFLPGICPVVFGPRRFTLSQQVLVDAKKFSESIFDEERKSINGIGKLVRKYIESGVLNKGKLIVD